MGSGRKKSNTSTKNQYFRYMRKNTVSQEVGQSAGGGHVPDASDVPGGAMGRGDDMGESAREARVREKTTYKKGRKKSNAKDND